MRYLTILSVLALTACGVDGAPERPEPGVAISGTAEFGISGSN